MSTGPAQAADWEPSDALDERLTDPERLAFPEDYTHTESWQRAITERNEHGGPINEAERMVWLEDSDKPKRVLFALIEDDLHAECGCASWQYRDWCAHVAWCWWKWVRGHIIVHHMDTGRDYRHPPAWLQFSGDRDRDVSGLTPAELDAYLTCDLAGVGVTEYADATDRVKGTVGNLLSRARVKVEGER